MASGAHQTDPMQRLTAALAALPGVGRRTAERMALRLAVERRDTAEELMRALAEVRERVRACSWCGCPTAPEQDPCRLCTGPQRDDALLAVVEDPGDIPMLEQSGGFRGRYHALMGPLSPMKGRGPAELRLNALLERIRRQGVREVVLALNTGVESEATAAYLAEALKHEGVRVTRLASGLPVGSGIRYADPVTLARAIGGRREA